MKIFNNENGIKKVYVQMNDIMMLNSSDVPIPASIYQKVFTNVVIVDDSNRMEFIEFTQPNEVKFFESIDWIVDYKQVRNLSEEKIKNQCQAISTEMNEIATRLNNTSVNNIEKQSLIQRHTLLDYKMKYLAEILLIKQGYKQVPFPVVPDSDGFSLVGDDNFAYEMRASLDPNKLLLFRKDGKELSDNDRIPQGFLQVGISKTLMEKSNEFFGNYEITHSLSEDKKYFVMEFKASKYENNNVQEQEKVEGKSKKRLLKKLFNNKNK